MLSHIYYICDYLDLFWNDENLPISRSVCGQQLGHAPCHRAPDERVKPPLCPAAVLALEVRDTLQLSGSATDGRPSDGWLSVSHSD